MRGLRFGRCPSAQMLRPTFREGRPDVVPLAVHRDLIDSGEHGAEQRSDHVLVGFRDPGQQIPDEMNTPSLVGCTLETSADRSVSPAC